MRNTTARIADGIHCITAAVGRLAIWCSLYIVIAEFAVVVMRYLFGLGSIRLQESVLYAHAALFMLAAAWVLRGFLSLAFRNRADAGGAPLCAAFLVYL